MILPFTQIVHVTPPCPATLKLPRLLKQTLGFANKVGDFRIPFSIVASQLRVPPAMLFSHPPTLQIIQEYREVHCGVTDVCEIGGVRGIQKKHIVRQQGLLECRRFCTVVCTKVDVLVQ